MTYKPRTMHMNKINPKKLALSKWTAITPVCNRPHKEKHFIVDKVTYDEDGLVTLCVLEAIINKREEPIDWQQLTDSEHWAPGWK